MWFPDQAHPSLARRITVNLSVGLALTLFLSFFVFHAILRNEMYARVEEALALRVQSLVEYAAANPGRESEVELLIEFRSAAHQDFFQVWDGSGRTLARSESSAGRDLPTPVAAALTGQRSYPLQLPDGHGGLATASRLRLAPGDPRGELTVVVAKEIESLELLEQRLHWIMLMVAGAALVAGVAAARYAVGRGLEPVEQLAQQIARIDPRAPRRIALEMDPLPDELEPLAEKTLSILDRLLAALERERRFSRNVAHELRTPLAELRMLADVGSLAQTTDEIRASLVEVGATAAELQLIIDSLLTLARYEAGNERPQTEPLELAGAVRGELERSTPAARDRGLRIDARLPREHWILSDATLLKRLIANLVGNAVAHAPERSTISVSLDADGSLRIANPAPHLDANDLARLRERFFRIDSGHGGAHAGLGLALSEAIADVLGARLDLRLDGVGGLIATLSGLEPLRD
jgi:two-component system sensor histidine kinase QseC